MKPYQTYHQKSLYTHTVFTKCQLHGKTQPQKCIYLVFRESHQIRFLCLDDIENSETLTRIMLSKSITCQYFVIYQAEYKPFLKDNERMLVG